MFTTIPDVFHNTYGWDLSLTGLAYTGCKILISEFMNN